MTILNRLKQMKDGDENKNYHLKSRQKFTDEYLINLVNKNSDFNMGELAKIAGVSQTTISNRIKIINSNGERIKYIKKLPNSKSKVSDKSNSTLTDVLN
ncbi:hypothetical protein CONCODRAFT_76657 [Conidiobolus coronatus NRRL 28638]|uniref:Helix-turn-helix type 11 domain-containing protein n=1 Tax=Conidiobolus coronatus (strain ATCC 28846 / CBS 209.66 / NRRL 28638) TaxID=796925 RepID=A0A137PIG3_CONC2|nr:hypothetical protein CONCODRAFT_76657 [Conidiobolus coronatus NRRL 28638]|eukprot:KXN74760.1 hypothetical protein CONCODRAFT_76657 [Conidiobolus coronatus NRRL 28638]